MCECGQGAAAVLFFLFLFFSADERERVRAARTLPTIKDSIFFSLPLPLPPRPGLLTLFELLGPMHPAIIALGPSDLVLYVLVAVVALYLIPRHLLHYWGRAWPGTALAGRGSGTATAVRRSARQATRHRRVE